MQAADAFGTSTHPGATSDEAEATGRHGDGVAESIGERHGRGRTRTTRAPAEQEGGGRRDVPAGDARRKANDATEGPPGKLYCRTARLLPPSSAPEAFQTGAPRALLRLAPGGERLGHEACPSMALATRTASCAPLALWRLQVQKPSADSAPRDTLKNRGTVTE